MIKNNERDRKKKKLTFISGFKFNLFKTINNTHKKRLEYKILFKKPSSFAKPIARIEKGRLLIVDKCQEKWCKIKSGDYEGWIKTKDIWGLIN